MNRRCFFTSCILASLILCSGCSPEADSVPLYHVGDSITFGMYEQDNDIDNGKEDIEWIILDINDNQALLISRYALDAHAYHENFDEITWRDCEIRAWLNSDFYNEAFSDEERTRIIETAVETPDNPTYSTDGGMDTVDSVFLLSIDEADIYFADNESRICDPTDYALAQGVYTNELNGMHATWWLRTPGFENGYACVVHARSGRIGDDGRGVGNDIGAVRPAVWISLN